MRDDMDRPLPLALGLCAGVGMLELGVDIAIGGSRVVGYVERDSFAAALLLERMEDAALEPAPVFAGDLAAFPWADFHGVVDIVTAGFPCQPHSVAGSRAGVEDERWIWPDIMAGIRVLRPGLVVLENVSGIRSSGGLAPVLGDLAESGYRVAWTSLRAADVGASHQRERVFIVGVDDAGRSEWWTQGVRGSGARQGIHGGREEDGGLGFAGAALADPGREPDERQRGAGEFRGAAPAEHREGVQRQRHGHAARDGGADVADDDGDGRGEQRRSGLLDGLRQASGDDADGCDDGMGDAERARRQAARGGSGVDARREPESGRGAVGDAHGGGLARQRRRRQGGVAESVDAVGDAERARSQGLRSALEERRHEPGRTDADRPVFAPGPADPAWPRIVAVRPDLAPAVEPGLRVLVDGVAYVVDESRADRLRAIGNGVVALQAAVAVRHLLRELGA